MLELITIMLNVIAPIFLILSAAYVIGKQFDPDPRSLSTYVIYLFGPALVFKGIYQTDLSGAELGGIMVVAVGVPLVLVMLMLGISRTMKYTGRAESSLALSVLLVNAGNYGIPLNTFAFGEEGGNVAIVYFVCAAMVGNTFGVFFASRGQMSAREAIINVFKVPMAYAAIIGLVFNLYNIQIPLIIERSVIDIASGASIPVMLALLGLQLARTSFKQSENDRATKHEDQTLALQPRAIGLAVGIKLLIAPFVSLTFVMLLGLSGTVMQVALVQSSMPTAVMASALATQFGGDARFASAVVIVATLASTVTLTVLIYLLGGVA